MFNKKKIFELECTIDRLNTINKMYKKKEELLIDSIKKLESINLNVLRSNIYVREDKIYLITLKEEKNIFQDIIIEIRDVLSEKKITELIAEYIECKGIHISSIDTDYNYQHMGHGSIAIQMLIKYAKDKNVNRIFGGLLISNDIGDLYRFYSSNGFDIKKTSFSMNL
ncbi:MAG: hypothetical protein ACLS9F_18120 [Clostridium paraputrificum]